MFSSRYTLWILLGLPLLELYSIAKLAAVFGLVNVLLWIIVSGVIGLRILQSHSWSIWSRVQQAVAAGQSPGRELLDSAFIIAAGVLLIVPGFLTDGLALLCLIPQSRARIARSLEHRFAGPLRAPGDDGGPHTIDGEYRREE